MGDEADYLFDQMLEQELDFGYKNSLDFDPEENFENNIWTTKDGRQIHLKEMEKRHLFNCLSYVLKRGADCVYGIGTRWVPKLEAEIQRRRVQ